MLQEIECLRMRVGQLQVELQREKDEKQALQEARINVNDAVHILVSCDLEPYLGEGHCCSHSWQTYRKLGRASILPLKNTHLPRWMQRTSMGGTGGFQTSKRQTTYSPELCTNYKDQYPYRTPV